MFLHNPIRLIRSASIDGLADAGHRNKKERSQFVAIQTRVRERASTAFSPNSLACESMWLASPQDYWAIRSKTRRCSRCHRHVGVDGRSSLFPKRKSEDETWGEPTTTDSPAKVGRESVRGALADAGLNGHKLERSFCFCDRHQQSVD